MAKDPFKDTPLSEQETSVIRLAAEGLMDREIAQRLAVSEKTIDTYWSRIRTKLSAKNRTHAVATIFRGAYSNPDDPLFGCESILHEMAIGVWVTDREGRTLYINPAMSDLTGLSATAVAGMLPDEIMAPTDGESPSKLWTAAIDDPAHPLVVKILTSEGNAVPVLMCISPIHDGAGEHFRFLHLLSKLPE